MVLKLLGRREGQAAFAVEQFTQSLVAGTGLTADDFRGDAVACFAASAAAFEPVFPRQRFIHPPDRDF